MFKAHLSKMLKTSHVRSGHLTERKDLWPRFDPRPPSKTLTVREGIFDFFLTDIRALYFFVLKYSTTSISFKSNSSFLQPQQVDL